MVMRKLLFRSKNGRVKESIVIESEICICGIMFIYWLVVYLKCGIVIVFGEAYYVVFIIIYRGFFFFNRDVNCVNIEDNFNFFLFL